MLPDVAACLSVRVCVCVCENGGWLAKKVYCIPTKFKTESKKRIQQLDWCFS
jgi:hypothetical protein